MAQLDTTSLTRFILTDEEQLAGQLLTSDTHQVIQNLIADYSEMALALKFDAANVVLFAQQEAELSGKIQVLKELLDSSQAAQIAVYNLKHSQPQY